MALGLNPARAVLNDVNPHLINFYNWLRRGLTISFPMINGSAEYYGLRKRFNELIAGGQEATAEAAGIFYYLNRTGYNGLCRFNSRGQFNVPFGRYRAINYVSDFSAYRAAFGGWSFEVADFEHLHLQTDDFVYADPPYDGVFTNYSKNGFVWRDQVRTAEWLARHEGPVVLSNQATPRIVKLYKKLGYALRFLEGPRMISCTGERTPAHEVLATKNI